MRHFLVNKKVFLPCFLALYSFISAQYTTEVPATVQKNHIEIETDFAYENYGNQHQYYTPAFFAKWGILENTELHLQTAITHNTSEEISFRGVSPLAIGFKTKLFPSKNFLPDVYLMANAGLHKTGSKIYHGTFLSPSLNLLFGNQLNEKTSLQYNVGSKWYTGTGQQMTTYSQFLVCIR